MRRYFLPGCLIILITACQPKKQPEQTAPETITPPAPVAAQLTETQIAEGWKLLFDGSSLDGWRFFLNKPNDSWEVVDGTLHCKPVKENAENLRSDIMTVDQYENFELAFEWKISPQGNSGVIYRATEEFSQPYFSGPEYQVIDNTGYPGDLTPKQLTGANYDMHDAPNAAPNAIGEWNSSRIVVNGNHVEHWLNGTKVVEYELQSADWKKRKAGSKWKDEKGYGMATKGHIDFQDHDHEVWYRNIMIKQL
ncbi:MAG: DUF1080 domain-containing protein [Cyclobacteriaceae bacterium]|nr:DUF1080 domain-containing protein [Cyclobacteriaceae bacterium]